MRKLWPFRRRRVDPRREVEIPVRFGIRDTSSEGAIGDISVSGARIERTPDRPSPGTRMFLELPLADSSSRFRVLTHVIRDTGTGFAVQFIQLDAQMRQRIQRLIRKLGRADD